MVDAFKKCGGNVKYTVYPDDGHGICDETYHNPELYEWFLQQNRNRK